MGIEKIDIFNFNYEDIKEFIVDKGEKQFRAEQIWRFLYQKNIIDPENMHNIGLKLKNILNDNFKFPQLCSSKTQVSIDGTRKWLLELSDKREVESVFIPEFTRGTLCISSQVGCTLSCKFCHTGTQRLVRNLTVSEIVGQILFAKNELSDWDLGKCEQKKISNIVLMGMGEPLYNFENVSTALKIIMKDNGLNYSRKKITLSTSGIASKLEECAKNLGVNLAISLHATRNDLRDILVPINKKYPIEELIKQCRKYGEICKGQKITFEYVMLKNVNDTDRDAKELLRLISGIDSKINLIPFNPWPGTDFERSDSSRIEKFAEIIRDGGYPSPVRATRGQDIMAACGQLKSDSLIKSKSILNLVPA